MNNQKRCLLFAFAVLVSGCSTYRGHKIGSDGKLPNEKTGIPFQMTKPEYTLNIMPSPNDATVPNYTVVATHVPDPENRYSLALDPASFADSTFLMKFGAYGNLLQNTGGTTSRVVATLTAASGFAVDVISKLRDEKTAYQDWKTTIGKDVSLECKRKEAVRDNVSSPVPTKAVQLVILDDIERIERLGNAKDDDAKRTQVLRFYHPRTTVQRDCLRSIHTTLSSKAAAVDKNAKVVYQKAIDPIAESEEGKKIVGMVEKEDIDGLSEWRKSLDPKKAGDVKLIGIMQLAENFLKSSQANQTLLLSRMFAEMNFAVWKARHLIYLEKKMEDAKAELLMMPLERRQGDVRALAQSNKINKLSAEMRALFDMQNQFARLDNLNDFLSRVRTTSDERNKPPRFNSAEYSSFRIERDLIESQIRNVRLEIIAGNEFSVPNAAPKIVEKKGIRVEQRNQDFVDAINSGIEKTTAPPAYVLVLIPRRAKLSDSPDGQVAASESINGSVRESKGK